MRYIVDIKQVAQEDLKRLLKSEPKTYNKALQLIAELYEHPKTGTGHPEPLKGDLSGAWSRRIDGEHRLVYVVENDGILILSCRGHYDRL